MNETREVIKKRWQRVKASKGFHNLLVYLLFVAVAAVFWLVLAMNDSVSRSFDVRIRVTGVPDSVTFITDVPKKLHLTVRDKGTSLLRRAGFHTPTVSINFPDFSQAGVFRVSNAELNSVLRQTFGGSAQISGLSIDSLNLIYTTNPGKRVPIVVVGDVGASSGFIVAGKLKASPRHALVYGDRNILDTVSRVFTARVVRRNLSETTTVTVNLNRIAGARIEPAQTKVTIPIEPLVKKTSVVQIDAVNVPEGSSLLLFPSRVQVSYYVPMHRFNEQNSDIEAVADYKEVVNSSSGRVAVHLRIPPEKYANPSLQTDSVEYTVVK